MLLSYSSESRGDELPEEVVVSHCDKFNGLILVIEGTPVSFCSIKEVKGRRLKDFAQGMSINQSGEKQRLEATNESKKLQLEA